MYIFEIVFFVVIEAIIGDVYLYMFIKYFQKSWDKFIECTYVEWT